MAIGPFTHLTKAGGWRGQHHLVVSETLSKMRRRNNFQPEIERWRYGFERYKLGLESQLPYLPVLWLWVKSLNLSDITVFISKVGSLHICFAEKK